MKNSKKKINLYFAASPVQLLCIKELMIRDKVKEFKLFLFLHRNIFYANRQMDLTLNILGFKDFEISWVSKNRLIRFLDEIIFIIKLKIKFKFNSNSLNFTIFDFRNMFLQSLRRYFPESKFTLIDDGFYTYVAHDNYMKRDIYLPINNLKSFSGKIAKILYFGGSYERLKKTSFNLFTIYADEINNKNAQMNNLNYLKEKIYLKERKFDKNKVYFIGTGMVERGAATLDQELGLLKKLNQFWQKN